MSQDIDMADFINHNIETPDFMNQDWYKDERIMADGGYGDSFRALKSQIDYNYRRYKEQLVSLETRKQNLKKDKNESLKMLLQIMFAPVGVLILMQIFTILGAAYGVFGLFDLGFLILLPIAVIVCEFFLLPAAARNLVNSIHREKVLNNPGQENENAIKNGKIKNTENRIITFVDEKKFLCNQIHKIEDFYERIEKDGIDQKGGKFRLGAASGELSDVDRRILDEMRGMSVFRDYKATVSELKRQADASWIIIGLGILVGVVVAILAFMLHQ